MKNNLDNQNSYINIYLKEAFSKLGKDQSEIVKDLGVSQPYVSSLMNGKKSVGKNMAEKLVNLYGFDKAKILTGEGSMLVPQIEEVVPEEEEESYLRTERNKYGLSLQDIHEHTQISVKDLRLYDVGEKNIPKKVMRLLQSYFERVEEEYENEQDNENKDIPILITEQYSPSVKVPYYNVDFAGGWSSEGLFSQYKPSFFITMPDFERAELSCNLIGNSISQRIKSGSIIGLRKVNDWQTYFPTNEVYAVVLKNDLRTVKLVRRAKEKGFIELVPAPLPEYNDPPYQTEVVPQDYIIEFYQVVATAIVERIAY